MESIIAESYRYEPEAGINGGTIWSPQFQNALEKGNRGSDEIIPFMVPIMLNRKPYQEQITAVRFSKDGQMAGAAFMPATKNSNQEGKVFLYRLYDP